MERIAKLAFTLLTLTLFAVVVQAGSNYMGQVLQTVNVTQIAGAAIALGQTTMSASLPVAFASNQSALPVTGTFFQTTQPVSLPAVSAPTITKVGATTSSAQLIASNATRKGIEVDCDCANTDAVAINFGASAAVYASHKQIPACSNYAPPAGVTLTSAIQIISNSGTQNCRVIEYP